MDLRVSETWAPAECLESMRLQVLTSCSFMHVSGRFFVLYANSPVRHGLLAALIEQSYQIIEERKELGSISVRIVQLGLDT
jgi:hypothetical protein